MRQIPIQPVLLDSLVTRVEEGDALNDEELALIGRQVEERPDSLDWRLCFAHALINSDFPQKALELLHFEGAEGMHEILLHIVRARAYGAMERYGEAEAELKKILRIYPGHADALRALALLRLREGAPAEAVRLCEDVLTTDPLDDATKQILAAAKEAMDGVQPTSEACGAKEADAAGQTSGNADAPAAAPPVMSRIERLSLGRFLQKLREALTASGLKHRISVRDMELFVDLPVRGMVRVSIEPFWREGRGTDAKRAESVGRLVDELTRLDREGLLSASDGSGLILLPCNPRNLPRA